MSRRAAAVVAALLALGAVPAPLAADTIKDALDGCKRQLDRVPARQREAYLRVMREMDVRSGDDRAKARSLAKAMHGLLDVAHDRLDAACRSTLLHTAALAEFIDGDATRAALDEGAAIDGGVADRGSPDERGLVYLAFGTFLHAAGRFDEALAAQQRAIAVTDGATTPDAVEVRAQARVWVGSLFAERASYEASARAYEAAAAETGASAGTRAWASVFAGGMRQIVGAQAESLRDYERALALAPDDATRAVVRLYHGLTSIQGARYVETERDGEAIVASGEATPPFLRALARLLLGAVYLAENRVADAREAYERARLELQGVAGSASEIARVSAEIAEAEMFVRLGRYGEARALLADAIPRAGSADPQTAMVFGGRAPYVASLYALDGVAALALGATADAAADLDRELEVLRPAPQSVAAAGALVRRSAIERLAGDFARARSDLETARAFTAAIDPARFASELDLQSGVLAFYAGDAPRAGRDFAAAFEATKARFGGAFGILGERDRLAFAQLGEPLFDAYLTFAVAQAPHDPSLPGAAYDVALFRKDLVAQTVTGLDARVRRSNDPAALRTYAELTAVRKQLGALATTGAASAERTQAAAALTRSAQDLERALAAQFPDLAAAATTQAPRWQDVARRLRPGEAAVELIRYRAIAARTTTGPQRYAAAVLRAGAAGPALIDLGPADGIEGAALLGFRQLGTQPSARALPADRHALFARVWAPLAPALRGARTVYLAADGVLHTVAFDLLQDDAGRSLGDALDLRLVDSTKDLLAPPPPARGRTALLLGAPAFDAAAGGGAGASGPASLAAVRSVAARAPLAPLPGTAAEIAAIGTLLRDRGWSVQRLAGAAATAEALEQGAHGKTIVHLATHGVFLPDAAAPRFEGALPDLPLDVPSLQDGRNAAAPPPIELPETVIGTPESDPMLRSLLFFAGANPAWTTRRPPPPGGSTGILTAAEAAALDLHGTQLVVLSACETGLGAVRSGDGVLGLRRALREAGARLVLMSLWRLPDRESSELMTAFYRHWLGGDEAHAALRAAEREERAVVRARYGRDDPFYWGGFILSGRG